MINRTAERVLSIIAAVFTTIGLIGTVLIGFFVNAAISDPEIKEEMRLGMASDGTLTPSEVEMFMSFFESISVLIWIGVIAAFVSLVLNIIGTVKIWNSSNPKAAGTLFIIAGLFGGIISLPSILLYIAGIICFTKKQPMEPQPSIDEMSATQTNWIN
ncbi:DUF4064 domain-containing protein [Sporosarcina obsidiansis]|uniref:DUF4064 domain-containing protein n=1 Tax=Sporosarcina obsidiansis TaxID=2660748 RepID=UPI00129B57C5|nr:DUF4064 domain-containing protein [Sporosarcina obsidiansis]